MFLFFCNSPNTVQLYTTITNLCQEANTRGIFVLLSRLLETGRPFYVVIRLASSHKDLAVCKAKKVFSFFSYFKTLNIGPALAWESKPAVFCHLQSCALSTELVLPRSDMKGGRLAEDFLFSKRTSSSRPMGYPTLRYKDVCKRDTKSAEIDPKSQG